MLRKIISVASISMIALSIAPSIAQSPPVPAPVSTRTQTQVVTHELTVDSVAACGVAASKYKDATLTDVIPKATGVTCVIVQIVKTPIQSRHKWKPSQPFGTIDLSIGAGKR